MSARRLLDRVNGVVSLRLRRSKQVIRDAIMDNNFLKNLDSTQVREIVDCVYERRVTALNGISKIRGVTCHMGSRVTECTSDGWRPVSSSSRRVTPDSISTSPQVQFLRERRWNKDSAGFAQWCQKAHEWPSLIFCREPPHGHAARHKLLLTVVFSKLQYTDAAPHTFQNSLKWQTF